MTNSRRNLTILLFTRISICAAILAAGIFTVIVLIATKPKAKEKENVAEVSAVEVMIANPAPVRRQWVGYGTAVAMNTADVSAEVAGIVSALGEQPQPGGDPVEIVAGIEVDDTQLLVQLDDQDFRNQAASLEREMARIDALLKQLDFEKTSWARRLELVSKEVKLAEADLDRVMDALMRDGAKQRAVDQAEQVLAVRQGAEVAAQEQINKIEPRREELNARKAVFAEELKVINRNIKRCTIKSPISGIVQMFGVELGEKIDVGERVARIVNQSKIEIPIRLPAAARSSVAVGDAILLESTNSEPQQWATTIRRIAPEDEENRTFTVYAEHVNGAGDGADDAQPLPPGKFLKGTATASRNQVRSVVPRRLLDRGRLLVIRDGVIRSIKVETAYFINASIPDLNDRDTEWAVLVEPLEGGTQVIMSPMRNMADGMPAKAKETKPQSSARSDEAERPSL